MTQKKKVAFYDQTMRDGAQSLWAMEMRYGTVDAVAHLIDEAGFSCIEVPAHPVQAKQCVRNMNENPWDHLHLIGRKIKKTKLNVGVTEGLDLFDSKGDPRSVVRFYYSLMVKATGGVTLSLYGQHKK